MEINFGEGKSEFGPGVEVRLSGDEVAIAIDAYLTAHNIHINGPRTITVNEDLCRLGRVFVDPSGFLIHDGLKYDGKGEIK